MKTAVYALLFIGLFLSCESMVEEPSTDLGYEYFPLEVGNTWIYQVDSTIFDTTGMGRVIDTTSSFVREQIVEKFIDNTDTEVFRIERSYRATEGDAWQVVDVWSAEKTEKQAIRTEENLRYIKMIFPLSENAVWDGNIFIDQPIIISIAGETLEFLKDWTYEVINKDVAEQIGTFAFDEVTTISQVDEENLIEIRFAREKYAKGVGLVFKEMRIMDTQNINADLKWENKAQKGFIMRQTLIEHF